MSALNPKSELTARSVVTVRGLAPELKARLRVRAAHNARSMEAEARAILEAALAMPDSETMDLAAFARDLFTPLGGIELELPTRDLAREPPDFGTVRDDATRAAAPASKSPAGARRR
jgi:plasmid stability protein